MAISSRTAHDSHRPRGEGGEQTRNLREARDAIRLSLGPLVDRWYGTIHTRYLHHIISIASGIAGMVPLRYCATGTHHNTT